MQSQQWLIIGLVTLPVMIVVIAMIIYYYNRKTTEELWRNFAARERLTFQRPLGIEGMYRGRRIVIRSAVKFRWWRKGYYPADWTRLGMHVNNETNAWLVIANDDNLSQLGQLMGVTTTELSGNDVNLRYSIRAQPKSVLNDVSKLNAKLDQINGVFSISFKDHSLCLDHGELITDHEYLLFLLDLLSDLARLVESIHYNRVEAAGNAA